MKSHLPVAECLVDGSLYALGSSFPIDGRISWLPSDLERGYEPINCYLVKDPESAILIDTGVAAQRRSILSQLTQLLTPSIPFRLLLTRPTEFDSFGNLGEVLRATGADTLYIGSSGQSSPLDVVDYADPVAGSDGLRVVRLAGLANDRFTPLPESNRLEVILPMLRLLGTVWAYDSATHTLFTSDCFGHVSSRGVDSRISANGNQQSTDDEESVRRHMYAKFGWLAGANCEPIRASIRAIFDQRDVEIVAPTHGCILMGRDLVQRHLELVERVLS